MPKTAEKAPKTTTPIEVVQKNNPLIKNIAKFSAKWHKRWPGIEQPWPLEGTLNPNVIKVMRMLVTTYKAEEKTAKKRQKRSEKRKIELAMLQLFEQEGQKLAAAAKDKDAQVKEEIVKNLKEAEKLMEKPNKPFCHTAPVINPPPYEKDTEISDIYPQLPVISHEGRYSVRNEDEQIIEKGKARTTIQMYPNPEAKTKIQSDEEEALGGYEPNVRRMLVKAEKRGGKPLKEKKPSRSPSDDSTDTDSNEDLDTDDSTRHSLKEIRKSISQCQLDLEAVKTPEARRSLAVHLEDLKSMERFLERKQFDTPEYSLRSMKGKSRGKMCPVIIRGQSLEYKPWQNTDMSDILEKLPALQDGAHPWISKLEEILIGTQPAMGDVKRLLANLLGVPAMEEILQKAGLSRYVATAVNDPELFSANRGRMWEALRSVFPTNVHPDNIIIEPLASHENPRAYVSRALQAWRNVTGNDPDSNRMEQAILRSKIQLGLPQPVRSRLAEVVGLGSMEKGVYIDHIAHQVELHRKKEQDQKDQDQDTLRKLTQLQLVDNRKKEKKQALMMEAQPAPPQVPPVQVSFQPQQQPLSMRPNLTVSQPIFNQPQSWRGQGRGNFRGGWSDVFG